MSDYQAMLLHSARTPLRKDRMSVPSLGPRQILIRVRACGVCRTDLHIVDGELTEPKLPLVPGHEIIGEIEATGDEAKRFAIGDRLGVSWLASTCGERRYCRGGLEDLCCTALFTGYSVDGGYAHYAVGDERYCFPVTAP